MEQCPFLIAAVGIIIKPVNYVVNHEKVRRYLSIVIIFLVVGEINEITVEGPF